VRAFDPTLVFDIQVFDGDVKGLAYWREVLDEEIAARSQQSSLPIFCRQNVRQMVPVVAYTLSWSHHLCSRAEDVIAQEVAGKRGSPARVVGFEDDLCIVIFLQVDHDDRGASS